MEIPSNLEFGFNKDNFSDRILRIAILPDEDKPDGRRKRLRDPQLQISEGEASEKNKTSSDEKHINVCSLILAGHSLFFQKLFSNGMKESRQHQATIHIQASEEAALMDMLKFMYSGKLSSCTPSDLLKVLGVADKFNVPSCIKLCTQLLNNLPMTVELALIYLDLDSTGIMVELVKPRLDTVNKYLGEHFSDIKEAKLQEEFRMLPLLGVESVLSNDSLQMDSEDDVYDLIQNWVQTHYQDQDQLVEKRKILNMLIRRFLRSPFISIRKLKNILSCRDIDPDVASELALGSLGYHLAQPQHKETRYKFIKRSYKYQPLKAIALDSASSHPQCIVYIDFTRDECGKMFPDGHIYSQKFYLGTHELALLAWCGVHEGITGLSLYFKSGSPDSETVGLKFSCEIASMQEPSGVFVAICNTDFKFPERGRIGLRNPFGVRWATFMGEDSPYFINDILHLRFHIRIKN